MDHHLWSSDPTVLTDSQSVKEIFPRQIQSYTCSYYTKVIGGLCLEKGTGLNETRLHIVVQLLQQ